MDIVKLVSQLATPGVLNQIATLLGVSQADLQKGLGAAVPGVLASLLGAAQRPGATEALGAALTQAGGDGGLAALLKRDPAAAAAAGSGALGSIVGSGGLGQLAEALGSHAGLSKSTGGALLGLAGAMALGALGGEARSKGLDAKGVLGLLESNKDQIAAALPPGLASALAGSGLLGSLGQPAAAASATPTPRAAPTPPKVEPRTPSPTPAPAPAPHRGMSWLWWLIGALIVIWLLWRFLAPAPEPVTEETAPPPAETTTAAPEAEPEPAPATTPEPATEPATEPEAEPAPATTPEPLTEPATPEPVTEPATEPEAEPERATEPATEPATPAPAD